jgi:asparagine synthase (glutamine-hydrolysing)
VGLIGKIKRRIGLAGLKPVTRQVLKEQLTYLSVEKLRRIERAMKETAGTPGAILEFGIALGGSGIILAQDARPERPFHGFDVFAMIPEPTSEKDDEKSKNRYRIIVSGQSKGLGGDVYYGYREDLYSEVQASFARHGAPVDNRLITLHKGLFEDTWKGAGVQRISLVHVDCDWYDPVKFCLEACADRMSVGGQIVIDDYHAYGGCRVAVDEFLAQRRDFDMADGENPILHKRSSAQIAR